MDKKTRGLPEKDYFFFCYSFVTAEINIHGFNSKYFFIIDKKTSNKVMKNFLKDFGLFLSGDG